MNHVIKRFECTNLKLNRARGYKTFFMLNSAENEICSAYKKIEFRTSNLKLSSCTAKMSMKFFLLINIKMPTNVGILIFISRKDFMLNWVEYEKSFITLGPVLMKECRHMVPVWFDIAKPMSLSTYLHSSANINITLTSPCNEHPGKPHFL